MLYYDRIDISERIDAHKTECDICQKSAKFVTFGSFRERAWILHSIKMKTIILVYL